MLRLHINNFQSIRAQSIDIEGFTTVVGPSDLGKSALTRALRAVLYNEYHPDFLRTNTDLCTLYLEIKNGSPISQIQLEKSKKLNQINLIYLDGQTKTFPKIGRTIPDDMGSMLNLGDIETEQGDKFNLNFQGQLEPLFLILENPIIITSFMNRVFGIHKYERALRNINSDQIKLNNEYKRAQVDLQKNKDEYEGVLAEKVILDEKIAHLSNLIELHQDLDKSMEALCSCIRKAEQVEIDRSIIESMTTEMQDLFSIQVGVSKVQELAESISNVRVFQDDLKEDRHQLNVLTVDLSNLMVIFESLVLTSEIARSIGSLSFLMAQHKQQQTDLQLNHQLEDHLTLVRDQLEWAHVQVAVIQALTGFIEIVFQNEQAMQNLESTQQQNNVALNEFETYRVIVMETVKSCPTCDQLLPHAH